MGVMAWFGSSFFMVLDWMEPSWIGWNHPGLDGTIAEAEMEPFVVCGLASRPS